MNAPFISLTGTRSRTLYRQLTEHHDLRVEERDGCRYLFSGGGRAQKQSCIQLSDLRRHVLDYSRLIFSSFLFVPAPRRVLVLGLGGAVIPRELLTCLPEAEVHVLEIDPEMVDVSKRFFYLPDDPRLTIWLGDGRELMARFVAERRAPFDLVVLDAFSAEYVPPHLMTLPFMDTARQLLGETGVVAANIFNSHPLFPGQVRTMAAAFGEPLYELRGTVSPSTSVVFAPTPSADQPSLRTPAAAEALAARLRLEFAMELPRSLDLAPFPADAVLRDAPPA
jgi:spermidine synthase